MPIRRIKKSFFRTGNFAWRVTITSSLTSLSIDQPTSPLPFLLDLIIPEPLYSLRRSPVPRFLKLSLQIITDEVDRPFDPVPSCAHPCLWMHSEPGSADQPTDSAVF